MKLKLLFFMMLMAALVLPALSFAQPGGVPNDPVDVPAAQTDIPFDGLTTILIAASVGYAAKKGREAKKRKQEKQTTENMH